MPGRRGVGGGTAGRGGPRGGGGAGARKAAPTPWPASAAAQVGPGPRRQALPRAPGAGSRCRAGKGPEAEGILEGGRRVGARASPDPYSLFPKPHPATSVGPPSHPEPLPSWDCGLRVRVRVGRRGADSPLKLPAEPRGGQTSLGYGDIFRERREGAPPALGAGGCSGKMENRRACMK